MTLPGGMVQTAQRRRWICPLPLRAGDDLGSLPDLSEAGAAASEPAPRGVTRQGVAHVRRPSQLIAAKRLRGPPSNENVLSAAIELAQAVEADGGRVVRMGGQPVIWQMAGELKNGFNSRRQLALSVWLAVPGPFRTDEVAVVMEEKS